MRQPVILDHPGSVAVEPKAARPIFVVGYQRSGTTAVHAALCRHSRLRQAPDAVKEPWFLQEFFLGRKYHANRPQHAGCQLDRAFTREYAHLVDRFCRRHLARGSQRWLAAHPDDRLFLDDLFELFPLARVVYLLRHPQESIWSSVHGRWLKFAHRGDFLNRARLEAECWRRSAPTVLKALAGGFAGRVLVVRHERLRADPESAARAILDHVGEPFEPEVARELGRVKNSSFLPENASSRLLKDRLAESLKDAGFCRIIAQTCGDAMRQLSYEPIGAQPSSHASEDAPADRLHVYFSRHGRRARWLAWLLGI